MTKGQARAWMMQNVHEHEDRTTGEVIRQTMNPQTGLFDTQIVADTLEKSDDVVCTLDGPHQEARAQLIASLLKAYGNES